MYNISSSQQPKIQNIHVFAKKSFFVWKQCSILVRLILTPLYVFWCSFLWSALLSYRLLSVANSMSCLVPGINLMFFFSCNFCLHYKSFGGSCRRREYQCRTWASFQKLHNWSSKVRTLVDRQRSSLHGPVG